MSFLSWEFNGGARKVANTQQNQSVNQQVRLLTGLSSFAQTENMTLENLMGLLKESDIDYTQSRYPSLFDGTIASIGAKLNPQDPNYKKKLKASLLANIRRAYKYKTQDPQLSQIAQDMQRAYTNPSRFSASIHPTNVGTLHWIYKRFYPEPLDYIPDKQQLLDAILTYKSLSSQCYINLYFQITYLSEDYYTQGIFMLHTHKEEFPMTWDRSEWDNLSDVDKQAYLLTVIDNVEAWMNQRAYPIYVVEDSIDIREVIL